MIGRSIGASLTPARAWAGVTIAGEPEAVEPATDIHSHRGRRSMLRPSGLEVGVLP